MKLQHSLIATSLFLLANSVFAQDLKEALKLVDNEQYDKAEQTLDQLLAKGTQEAYFFKGYIAEQLEDKAKAAALYQQGVSKAPETALNYVGLGRLALLSNDATKASAQFDKAIALSKGKDVMVLNKIAEAYINANQHEKAFEPLTKAQKLDPKNIETLLLFGDAHLSDPALGKRDGSKAVDYYKQAQNLDKTYSKATVKQGQIYQGARNVEAAIAEYKKAMEINGNYAPVYRQLGDLYFTYGHTNPEYYKYAKTQYAKFLELSSQNKYAHRKYATILYLIGDATKSKAYFTEAAAKVEEIHKTDTSSNLLNRVLAYSLYETKEAANYPKAYDALTRFYSRAKAENNEIIPLDYSYEGRILAKMGKENEAIMPLNNAINKLKEAKDKSSQAAYDETASELATVFMKQKKFKEAAYIYDEKIKAGKATVNDYLRSGIAYSQDKQYEDADKSYSKVVELAPNYADGYFYKGSNLAAPDAEYKGAAKETYETYITKVNESLADTKQNLTLDAFRQNLCEANRYLALYYNETAKDKAKATEHLNKMVELDAEGKIGYKAYAESCVKVVASGGSLLPKKASETKPEQKPAPKTGGAKPKK